MVALALLVIIAMKLFPTLPFARSLHHWLVRTPIEWFASVQRHHVICVLVMVGLLLAPETLMLLGAADLSVLAFALDMSLYIDAAAMIALVGGFRGAMRGWRIVRQRMTRQLRPVNRARRRRAVADRKPPANDNADPDGDRIAA